MGNKKLITNILTFGFGEFLNKLIPFILLPILTNYLTPEEYGYVTIYSAALSFLLIIISLSLQANVSVFYFKVDKYKLSKIISSSIAISFIALIIIQVILLASQSLISRYYDLEINWLVILAFTAFFQTIGLFYLTLLRVQGKLKHYIVFQISLTLINAALSLFFVILINYSWQGRLSGISVGIILLGLVALLQLNRNKLASLHSIKKDVIYESLKFSVPLIVHAISSWIKSSLDKILLMGYLTITAAGEYAVMFQMCSVLLIFLMMLNQVLQPELFKVLKEKKTGYESQLKKVIYCLLIGIVFVSYCFYLVLPYIYQLLIDERYVYNNDIALLLISAFCMQGFYLVFVNFLFFAEKTKNIGFISLVNGFCHVLLGFWLIPMYGVKGAAWLAFLSLTQFTFFIIYSVYKNKLLPHQLVKSAGTFH